MLLHIPQVLNSAQIAECRQRLNQPNAGWIDGKASVGNQGAQVKRNRQLPETSELAQYLGKMILQALQANPLFFSAALPLKILPPYFNAYQGGEHYGLHVDGAIRFMPQGEALRTDVSSTLFLSEPDEYQGGDLVVVDAYGTHEVKLPAGDLLVYPATSLHRIEPVTQGTRLAAFFWTQSMVRDDWQRHLLFDLDQNIQQLRQQIGDTAQVVSLTGHYHNLLRQWAET